MDHDEEVQHFSLEDVLAGKAGDVPPQLVALLRTLHAKMAAGMDKASQQASALVVQELAAEYARFVYRASRCQGAWVHGDQTKERCAKGFARETIASRLCRLLADATGGETAMEWQAKGMEHKANRLRWSGRMSALLAKDDDFSPEALLSQAGYVPAEATGVDEQSFAVADAVNKLLEDAGIFADEGAVTPTPDDAPTYPPTYPDGDPIDPDKPAT